MSDGQHEYVDYMHNHHHLFSDLENVLKMKKDKVFYRGERFKNNKELSVELLFSDQLNRKGEMVTRLVMIAGYDLGKDITHFDIPSAKKFSKALRKGLKRLEER